MRFGSPLESFLPVDWIINMDVHLAYVITSPVTPMRTTINLND
jgi:hypothetical protein